MLVVQLGLALGGRPAARFARRLVTPVSNDTLLRAVRRRGRPGFSPPRVVGLDAWAGRRDQVADRWHLMENASRAFLDAVRASMRPIRAAIGATVVDPALLTAAQRLPYDGFLRREEAGAVILAQAKAGLAIKEIVRRTGHSRGTVRAVPRGQRTEMFRTRETSFEAYLPFLDAEGAQ